MGRQCVTATLQSIASNWRVAPGGVAMDGRLTSGVCLGETLVRVPLSQSEHRRGPLEAWKPGSQGMVGGGGGGRASVKRWGEKP